MGEAKEVIEQAKIENARVGYQVAVSLRIHEGELFWDQFNALLVANSIFLATIGLAMSTSSPLRVFSLGMPIAGIILCMLWFLLTKRRFAYRLYYTLSAREIEEKFLSDSVQTISRGGDFADGKEIKLTIGGRLKPLQLRVLDRLALEWWTCLIISIFFMIYVAIFIVNIVN